MNENCLKDIRCPSCGNEDGFYIAGNALFHVTDDGTDEYEEVEWDCTSYVRCAKCNHEGDVSHFSVFNQQKDKPLKKFEVSARIMKRYTTEVEALNEKDAVRKASEILQLDGVDIEDTWDEDYDFFSFEVSDDAQEVPNE